MLNNAQDNKQGLEASPNKSKRPDTLETILFVIALLRLIPRDRKVTALQLKEQLAAAGIKRDIRSIQRQLEMLSNSREFGIECDTRNKPFGYRWMAGSEGLALPILSQQESLLLALAQRQLASLLPTYIMSSMESLFSQARYYIDSKNNIEKERQWLSKVRVVSETQPLITPPVNPDIFNTVSKALYENEWLTIEYKKSDGSHIHADIMPLGLAQQGSRLYLVCRFKDPQKERSLALHRFITAKAGFSFERPLDFDLEQYDADGQFGFGHGEQITLNFVIRRNRGSHLLEYKLSRDQTFKDLGDELEITATVVDCAHLDWWLASFGDGVRDITKWLINPDRDDQYEEVLSFILAKKKVSPSQISRTFNMTWQRAALIVEEMESLSIVSEMSSNGKRTILVD